MTEKRFTIKPQDDYFGVTDNYSADKVNVVNGIRTEIEAEWLCELLNELHDENEQLKQEKQAIKNIISKLNNADYYLDSAILDEEIQKIATIVGEEYE